MNVQDVSARNRTRVLYLGDWVFHTGPSFCESPFHIETKDCDLHFYGRPLKEALDPLAVVTTLSNWQLYRLRPGEFEDYLSKNDVIIVSDVEAKCFHLSPDFFERQKYPAEKNVNITFPDRLELLKKWVGDGGGLMFLGGWLSFSGSKEEGGWRRSTMAEVLPVECLVGEDLVESSAGYTLQVVAPEHPVVGDLPWHSCPSIFGYNEVTAKPGAEVVVRVRETGHPLVITGTYKQGRIYTFASDPVPHWALNFERWDGYPQFWQNAMRWALGAK